MTQPSGLVTFNPTLSRVKEQKEPNKLNSPLPRLIPHPFPGSTRLSSSSCRKQTPPKAFSLDTVPNAIALLFLGSVFPHHHFQWSHRGTQALPCLWVLVQGLYSEQLKSTPWDASLPPRFAPYLGLPLGPFPQLFPGLTWHLSRLQAFLLHSGNHRNCRVLSFSPSSLLM